MTANRLERRIGNAQDAASQPEKWIEQDVHCSAGGWARAMPRLLCGLWFSFLLVIWPSSDWIGLLVLSQALFAAACLLRSSKTGPAAGPSPESVPLNLAQGEDNAH